MLASHQWQPHGESFLPMKRRSWPRNWPTTSATVSIGSAHLAQRSILPFGKMVCISGVVWMLAGLEVSLRSLPFDQTAANLMWKSIFRPTF
jgi:hypothetical protein